MPNDLNVLLQASVTVFGFEAHVDVQLVGGPVSIRLTPVHPVSFPEVWAQLSGALEEIAGFGLPDLGAWKGLISAPTWMEPSLYLGPSGSNAKDLAVYLELAFLEPIHIGGSIDLGGGVTVSIEPEFDVHAIYLGYDASAGGLSLRAKISNVTSAGPGSPGGTKTQLVSYPFPVPAQDSVGTFQLHYLGIGQRVGPTVEVTAQDPMAAIFNQLESELAGDDPVTVLTTLAKNFYQPQRDWFIAADLEMKGFRLRVLFNDPTMYGLEVSVAANAPTPFAGLLFEILYQKLSPNLGLYYGALTLPTLMRRIPLEGFILILPGFQVWVYTNGDFRVNVGWPLGDDSAGISFEVLVGRAGFYFAKVRSADNPGAQSSANYAPILAFGIGVGLFVDEAFNAGIFSARISVALTATFQGLLAWKAGNAVSGPPDHYWFAGTASLAVLIQGTVDFSIIKASVTISFTANVGVAFETGYATNISVSATVRVEVSLKVIFFTIRLSFHTGISRSWPIGSGPPASVNQPLAPGLAIAGGFGAGDAVHARALEQADRLITRFRAPRAQRVGLAATSSDPWTRLAATSLAAAAEPAHLELQFVLQPTVVYASTGDAQFNVVASLLIDCPAPDSPASSPGQTSFERLISALVHWLLTLAPPGPLSQQFAALCAALGAGSEAPFGDWNRFAQQLGSFLENACRFHLTGVDLGQHHPGRAAAVLPMLDALRLTYLDVHGQQVSIDFDRFDPAPANYPEAVNLYFEQVAWSGQAPAETSRRAMQHLALDAGGTGMASFVLVDYFLLQARNAVNALHQAAVAYEGEAKARLFAELDAKADADHFDPISRYAEEITGDSELDVLLEHFDYLSAAGLGSRLQLGGLQLPQPSQVPPQPTRENMAHVPTAPLFTLTGQQFAALAGQVVSATLSVNPDSGAPAGWLTFDGSPAQSAVARLPLPAQVPPEPVPEWRLASPSVEPGTIDVGLLPPITPHPLFVTLKNQVAWATPEGAQTLLPLPPQLTTLLASQAISLTIAPEAPPSSNPAAPPGSPVTPLAATPALLIRLSLAQVPAANANVTQGGSPVAAASPPSGVAHPYLPFVYQLSGADETTRDLIHLALLGDLSHARISLAWTSRDGSPLGGAMLRSEALSPEVLIARTNLSTLNQVPQSNPRFGAMATLTSALEADAATVSDVAGFLRLLWEVSVVNAPGFFLFYLSAGGEDLPASLFSDAGSGGGLPAELDVVVELASAPGTPTTLPRYANAVVLAEGGLSTTLYAQVFDAAGAVVPVYAPTFAAGNVGLSIHWERAEASPDEVVPVEDLYHLLQYRVLEGSPGAGSVWSLPIGPTRDNLPSMLRKSATAWQYVQLVPAWLFAGPGSPTQPSRYAPIGHPLGVELRVVDLYGNALPQTKLVNDVPLYQDPLVALGEWPGVVVRYQVVPGTGTAAVLDLTMHFDPGAVVPPGDSPGNVDPRRAWNTALERYRAIVEQLTDPHLHLCVESSLVGGAVGDDAQNRDRVTRFAEDIVAAIASALRTAPSPDVPVVEPLSAQLSLPLPFAALSAVPDDIFAVSVAVTLSRPPELVCALARAHLPAVAEVSTTLTPDLTSPGSSPGASGNLTVFAVPFERAFQNFDGQGGCLKLAQRAGVHSGEHVSTVQSLWVVRWSERCGYSVTLGDQLAYFALQPLSNTPMNHVVDGQTFSGVDLDAWARDFLLAFDALLSPELAAAIAVLDAREGTTHFEDLLDAKARLARTIPRGVMPLFSDEQGGDLQAARARLEQALLTALGSAYTVTTLVQVPAQVGATGSPNTFSPDVAPRLFGALGPPPVSGVGGAGSPAGGAPYQLSGAELDLVAGASWMTSLLTVAQPGAQAELTLPLAYQVGYLQHDFEPDEAFRGYVPSSWLKFVLPDAAPLQMQVSAAASLPIPLVLEPPVPQLLQQSATAAPMSSPAGGEVREEIADALRWLYTVGLGLSLARQDDLFFDVTWNRHDPDAFGLRASGDGRLALLGALARFRSWYATAASQLPTIAAAAFPHRSAAGAASSPLSAEELICGFRDHARQVAAAWAGLFDGFSALRAREEQTDHFRFSLDSSAPTTVHLWGQVGADGPPKYWPSIRTADGQWWHPAPGAQGSPGDWVELSHTFAPGAEFDTLTFQFGPIDIMDRQSATAACFVTRNASLLPGRTTAPAFVYTTQTARFPNSVLPLIHRASLPLLQPGVSLLDTLADLFTPLERPGAGLAPQLRLSASHAFACAVPPVGPPLMSTTAMRLVDRVSFEASPVSVLHETARALAQWQAEAQPSSQGAVLHLAVTLFGTLHGQELPLVQLDDIPISVAGLPSAWWQSGQTRRAP